MSLNAERFPDHGAMNPDKLFDYLGNREITRASRLLPGGTARLGLSESAKAEIPEIPVMSLKKKRPAKRELVAGV
jgi:hypothetical protein